MGRYENPQVTIIDPSKNLKAFQNNFNKAYAAVDAYRKEKQAREEKYENEVFAVGNKMYETLEAAELYSKKAEQALFDSVKDGTSYIMANKLNRTEQLTLAKSHAENVDILNQLAARVVGDANYRFEINKIPEHIQQNASWMEIASAFQDKKVDVTMSIDESGRQARYKSVISFPGSDGKTKTMDYRDLATLLGYMNSASNEYKAKNAKLDLDIKSTIDSAQQMQNNNADKFTYNTASESINKAVDQKFEAISEEDIEFMYENKLTPSQRGTIEEGKDESLRRKQAVKEWYKTQITDVKPQKLKADGENLSAKVAAQNNELQIVFNDMSRILGELQDYQSKTEFGKLGVQQPLTGNALDPKQVPDYERMADDKANILAGELNRAFKSSSDKERYLGRSQALIVYKKRIRDEFEANNEGKKWDEIKEGTEKTLVNPDLSDYSLEANFNKAYPRKSKGVNAKPEFFYIEDYGDGSVSFPYQKELSTAAELTESIMLARGSTNWSLDLLRNLSKTSGVSYTPPTDRGKGL